MQLCTRQRISFVSGKGPGDVSGNVPGSVPSNVPCRGQGKVSANVPGNEAGTGWLLSNKSVPITHRSKTAPKYMLPSCINVQTN